MNIYIDIKTHTIWVRACGVYGMQTRRNYSRTNTMLPFIHCVLNSRKCLNQKAPFAREFSAHTDPKWWRSSWCVYFSLSLCAWVSDKLSFDIPKWQITHNFILCFELGSESYHKVSSFRSIHFPRWQQQWDGRIQQQALDTQLVQWQEAQLFWKQICTWIWSLSASGMFVNVGTLSV